MKSISLLLIGSVLTFAAALSGAASGGSGRALMIEINDAIGPATSDYFLRTLERAEEEDSTLVLVTMDTPGGLDTAMREIIKGILSSPVPVVTFVYPGGSRAASAGTYILYASHVAAMAPATNLGAATPVAIGGSPPKEKDESSDSDDDEADQPEESASERKAINDAVAYIRSLAEKRGRNADWAEDAVRSAVSLTAEQALQENVIDFVAEDIDDLLRQLDGHEVKIAGEPVELVTSGLILEEIEPDWRTRLLATITNPTVAYLLLLVGIYGLLFEGYNPGALVPGVIGGICLLLALFAFQVLPVNYAGLALMALGVALMIAEAFAPSFGILGIGGVLAFVFGSIILMDTDIPGFGVSRGLITGIGFIGSLLVMGIVGFAMRARAAPIVSGAEQLLGGIAEATNGFKGSGTVFIHGERWNARSDTRIRKGQRVKVTAIDGLWLTVEPLPQEEN